MRSIFSAVLVLLLFSATASGQSITLQGSAGPTIRDTGYSAAAAIGFSPTSRLTVLFGAEQTHLASRVTTDGSGNGSAFRGGTFTFAEAELQVSLLPRERASPYLLGGVGVGKSRPNVNDLFPDPITNDARAIFFGGGIRVPLGEKFSVFGDVRMTVGLESREVLAVVPLRVGAAWRF